MNALAIEEIQDLDVAKAHITTLSQTLASTEEQLSEANEQLAWLKKQLFGPKKEREVADESSDQLTLEGFDPIPEEEKQTNVSGHTRKSSTNKGSSSIAIPEDLPVETIELDIPDEQKRCPDTNLPLCRIGEEVSYKLAHKPARYFLKKYVRPKYAHPIWEEQGVVVAPMPESLLYRCKADESLLAEIAVKKFGDHLPLYRIEDIFRRDSIGIPKQLLSTWLLKMGKALTPLYNALKEEILQSGNIFVDESPVNIQRSPTCKTGYMWVIAGGKNHDPPLRFYHFTESRKHKHVNELLGNYAGVYHSDKYGAYEMLAEKSDVTWCPCLAHIRRKFIEAEAGDEALRKWVIRKIKYLFMYERIAWEREADERLYIRREKEAPIIDEIIEVIRRKLEEEILLPKSKLSKALKYCYGLKDHLKNYIENPYARLDNNVAERAIRPLTIGRKNWLFIGSHKAGKSAAVLFSFIQSCRALNINARDYLEDVMRKLNAHPANKLSELLPHNWNPSK